MKGTKSLLMIVIPLLVLMNLIGVFWIIHLIQQNINNSEPLQTQGRSNSPEFQYEVSRGNGFTKKWVLQNIFVNFERLKSELKANDGKLFIQGALQYSDPQSILVLNSFDGSLIWKTKPIEIGSDFAVGNDALFIATNSSGELQKISLKNFEEDWKTVIDYAHGPCCMQVVGDQLQGAWQPNQFFVLSRQNGSIVTRLEKEGSPVFRVDSGVKYYRGGTTTFVAATLEGENLWTAIFDEEYWQLPVFDETIIFIRSGIGIGKIYAIDRESGDFLWTSTRNVISSIAQSKEHLYYFTKTGELVGVNKTSGKVDHSVQLVRDGRIPENVDGMNNFDVAYDETELLLYLFLGDSAQLFAFQEENNE